MDQKLLDRINELSHKRKTVGLTPEEEAERAQLHKEYIAAYRAYLRGILDNTVIERPDGTRENVKDRYKGKDNE